MSVISTSRTIQGRSDSDQKLVTNFGSSNSDRLDYVVHALSKELHHSVRISKKENMDEHVNNLLVNMKKKDHEINYMGHNSVLGGIEIDSEKVNYDNINIRNKSKSRNSYKSKKRGHNHSYVSDAHHFKNYFEDSFEHHNNSQMNRSFSSNKTHWTSEKNIYKRFQIREQKKQYLLTLERNKKRNSELSQLRDRPQLSENTKNIIHNRFSSQKPVYLRTNEDFDPSSKFFHKTPTKTREKKTSHTLRTTEDGRFIKIQKKPLQNNKGKFASTPYTPPKYINTIKNFNPERNKKFLNGLMTWENKRNEKIQRNKMILAHEEREDLDKYFRPVICKTSEKIDYMKTLQNSQILQTQLEQNDENQERIQTHVDGFIKMPRYEKLYYERANQQMRLIKLNQEFTPSFSPLLYKAKGKKIEEGKMGSSTPDNISRKMDFINNPTEKFNIKQEDKVKTPHKRVYKRKVYGKNQEDETAKTSAKKNKKTIYEMNNDYDYLYKLNVRSSSAWDKNKENSIYFDQKYAGLFMKTNSETKIQDSD
jgi:hypothetical protein